jgi:sensor histidine kinase YesM
MSLTSPPAKFQGNLWRTARMAGWITLLIYYIVVYLNNGRIGWPSLHTLLELSFGYLLYFCILYGNERIAFLFQKTSFLPIPSFWRTLLEAVSVIVLTLILVYFVNYMPFVLMAGDQGLKSENVRVAFTVTPLMSLFVYYYIERSRNRTHWQEAQLKASQLESENYKAQLQLLSDQLSPHFLFNSLNVLSSLIPRDPDKALHFTYKLSDLYRTYLRNTEKDLVTLSEEWEVVEAYIYLLETRFGPLVQIEKQMDWPMQEVLIPPGSLQALLENAVKHNAATKANPLHIRIYTDPQYLYVANPKRPRMEDVPSTKNGLKNLQLRYALFTKQRLIVEHQDDFFRVGLPYISNE